MVYSVEQDTFIVMCCYRIGTFLNEEEWVYSITARISAKYHDLIIQETSSEAHTRDVINRFVRTGSINKGKSPGRPSVSEEVVDDLGRIEQTPQKSLTRFPQLSGVPIATRNWTKGIDERITDIKKRVNMWLEQNDKHFEVYLQ